MSNCLSKAARIVHRPRESAENRGHTVWADTGKTAISEPVSNQMLRQLIDADNDSTANQLREVAAGQAAVPAHDPDKDRFEIINDKELQHILHETDAEYGAEN